MTTRRNIQRAVLRYSLAAGRFVPPHSLEARTYANVRPWCQLTRLLLTANSQDTKHTSQSQGEQRQTSQPQSKRATLVARAKRVVAGKSDSQANSYIKGYSGALLATSAVLQRSSQLPYDDYLGKPLLEHTLVSLEHAYERFVIADEVIADDVDETADNDTFTTDAHKFARYPELMPSKRVLSGLHSALSFAFQDWVAVVAYDMPHISSHYWDYMFAKRGGAPIVIAQDASGEFAPLAALYHRSVIMQVAHLLENSQGDVEELLSVCGATVIPWESLEVRFGRQLFMPAVAVGQPPL